MKLMELMESCKVQGDVGNRWIIEPEAEAGNQAGDVSGAI
jgi:hypothetical protein